MDRTIISDIAHSNTMPEQNGHRFAEESEWECIDLDKDF